jgi:hypothetical protein
MITTIDTRDAPATTPRIRSEDSLLSRGNALNKSVAISRVNENSHHELCEMSVLQGSNRASVNAQTKNDGGVAETCVRPVV